MFEILKNIPGGKIFSHGNDDFGTDILLDGNALLTVVFKDQRLSTLYIVFGEEPDRDNLFDCSPSVYWDRLTKEQQKYLAFNIDLFENLK